MTSERRRSEHCTLVKKATRLARRVLAKGHFDDAYDPKKWNNDSNATTTTTTTSTSNHRMSPTPPCKSKRFSSNINNNFRRQNHRSRSPHSSRTSCIKLPPKAVPSVILMAHSMRFQLQSTKKSSNLFATETTQNKKHIYSNIPKIQESEDGDSFSHPSDDGVVDDDQEPPRQQGRKQCLSSPKFEDCDTTPTTPTPTNNVTLHLPSISPSLASSKKTNESKNGYKSCLDASDSCIVIESSRSHSPSSPSKYASSSSSSSFSSSSSSSCFSSIPPLTTHLAPTPLPRPLGQPQAHPQQDVSDCERRDVFQWQAKRHERAPKRIGQERSQGGRKRQDIVCITKILG
eukprot:m.18631 g.18631  ORF g.18631 m.18631 type:complete len:345 (+) comp4990_c0_seq1:467-1501(+)